MTENINRRFGGIARLYGHRALERFTRSHVCVIGVGGVGSWAVEALARSAIGQLTLIDMDHVAESNINRQLQALSGNLGKSKIQVMSDRIAEINPQCSVELVDDFISTENLSDLLHSGMDFVIDCIDDSRTKAALIAYCKSRRIQLITTGGAGGKRDPGKIRLSDLARTEQDPLLARTRNLLRKNHGFTRHLKDKFKIPCVWSPEPASYLDEQGETCQQRPVKGISQALNCGGLGSSMPVTASFGHLAVAHVLDQLGKKPAAVDSNLVM